MGKTSGGREGTTELSHTNISFNLTLCASLMQYSLPLFPSLASQELWRDDEIRKKIIMITMREGGKECVKRESEYRARVSVDEEMER